MSEDIADNHGMRETTSGLPKYLLDTRCTIHGYRKLIYLRCLRLELLYAVGWEICLTLVDAGALSASTQFNSRLLEQLVTAIGQFR